MKTTRIASAVTLVIAAALGAAAGFAAGEHAVQSSVGASFFLASPPCPVKQFPTFESVAPVPRFVDTFAQDLIPVFCEVQVKNEGKGVKNARGTYESDLVVIDNRTGEAESFPVGSGRFRTNSAGSARFDVDLPAELFADGFESGDVSAWSYTRTDFTNRKRGTNAEVQCVTSAGRSSE